LGKRGRKRTPGEKQLMLQVAKVFSAKLEEKGGARKVAKDLGVSLASVYNYASGGDLPRMEVLRDAQEKWAGVKWELIDVSQITRKKKITSPEQYVLSFLQEVRTEDVEVAKIGPRGERILQVLLNIRFPG
jgi:predicted transcriptional regulator